MLDVLYYDISSTSADFNYNLTKFFYKMAAVVALLNIYIRNIYVYA